MISFRLVVLNFELGVRNLWEGIGDCLTVRKRAHSGKRRRAHGGKEEGPTVVKENGPTWARARSRWVL